jgi:preprotein translocase subunit Sec63
MDFAEGFGLVGMIFLIYAAVLAIFLPFYVMGIYNQSKELNNNLQRLDRNLLVFISRIEHYGSTNQQLLADALDKGSSSSGKRIS